MITYSTCGTCRTLLHTTSDDDTYHPTCQPPPKSRIDQLCEDFRAAVIMGDQPALEAQLERDIEELQARPPQLHAAAMAYVSWGWPVFPLRPVGGACLNAGKPTSKCTTSGLCQCPKVPATPHGFQDATLDRERVDKYWTRYPDANIGLPTGEMFDVVGIDVPLGVASWTKLLAEGKQDLLIPGDHNVHGKVVTASGGQHLYVKPTGAGNLANLLKQAGLHGIDYRGKGGYVVAPPSWLGVRGRSWSWLVKPSPEIRA